MLLQAAFVISASFSHAALRQACVTAVCQQPEPRAAVSAAADAQNRRLVGRRLGGRVSRKQAVADLPKGYMHGFTHSTEENQTAVKDEPGTRPPRPRCSSRTLRTSRTSDLQDSPYTYAGDQTKVSQTGVKVEPQWDKWVTLTIMHIDGSAIKPTFLADPALSVHQLLHGPLLAKALSVDDDTKFALRVVSSSPRRCRLLHNMEEKLGDVLAHEQSGRPRWAIWRRRPLRSELKLSVTPHDAGY